MSKWIRRLVWVHGGSSGAGSGGGNLLSIDPDGSRPIDLILREQASRSDCLSGASKFAGKIRNFYNFKGSSSSSSAREADGKKSLVNPISTPNGCSIVASGC